MKKTLLTLSAFAVLTVFSCKKESSSTTTTTNTTGGGTITTTKTSADLTTITTGGEKKAGYSVLVFEQPFSPTQTMPPILMQAKTDAQGNVVFNLESALGNAASKTFYFEAFTQSSSTYTLKSIVRTKAEITKDTKTTTSIIVE